MSAGQALRQADEVLLGFTVALRAGGVPVTPERARNYLAAVALTGLGERAAAYHAGQATLCSSPADLLVYDRVHQAYFDPDGPVIGSRRREPPGPRPRVSTLPAAEPEGEPAAGPADVVRAAVSDLEVLRQRDIADLDPAEKARLAYMFASLQVVLPQRRAARRQAWHRGSVDASRTLRAGLRRLGEPGEISWRRPARKDRTVVLLLDVSGSMRPYAEALLRLAHHISRAGPVETFTLGTRLTRLTRALDAQDPQRATAAAGAAVPDWSGGTRLGETVQAFADRWGRRGLARGAVVVLFSDGWERGDAQQLGEQMARLARLAHRVIWVNPHRGKVGYAPLQAGMAAALPHVDDFVAGHSLAAFAHLLEVIRRA